MKPIVSTIVCLIFCLSVICCASKSNDAFQVELINSATEESVKDNVKESQINAILLENGEVTIPGIFDGRDPNLYENAGGHFADDKGKVRDFVWNCWQEKRRGYIRLTYFSIEGEASTSHIFIEPRTETEMRIVWRIVRASNLLHELPEITAVEKVKLPKNEGRSGSYELMFKDSDGSFVHSDW
jgi:hypothetical protein